MERKCSGGQSGSKTGKRGVAEMKEEQKDKERKTKDGYEREWYEMGPIDTGCLHRWGGRCWW